jgi:hypothetical protein
MVMLMPEYKIAILIPIKLMWLYPDIGRVEDAVASGVATK